MITGYLHDIIIIFAFAIIIVAIGNRFRVPGIVGFILTGIFADPFGLGLIEGSQFIDYGTSLQIDRMNPLEDYPRS